MNESTSNARETIASRYSLVRGGSAYVIARRLGLDAPARPRRLLKVLLLVGVTWVPLVILSIIEGHAFGDHVAVSLLHDWVIFSRLLIALPLLIMAEGVVEAGLAAQAIQFVRSGLLTEREMPAFKAAEEDAISLRASKVADCVIVVLAVAMAVVIKVMMGVGSAERGWVRVGESISLAGWWYFLVSLPILLFHLLSWLWVYVLWTRFLFGASRLDLKLTATHPDKAGGLGFLGWGMMSFAPVLLAVSAVMAGGFAHEILHRGSSLDELKFHVMVFVVLAVGMLHAPLVSFAGRLSRCRTRGLMEFSTLIGFHDRAFDEKWIEGREVDRATLLGSAEVSSLADIAHVFDDVQEMRAVPFDKQTGIVLVICALLPMAPLVGTAIPLQEIVEKLAELMI